MELRTIVVLEELSSQPKLERVLQCDKEGPFIILEDVSQHGLHHLGLVTRRKKVKLRLTRRSNLTTRGILFKMSLGSAASNGAEERRKALQRLRS